MYRPSQIHAAWQCNDALKKENWNWCGKCKQNWKATGRSAWLSLQWNTPLAHLLPANERELSHAAQLNLH